MQRRVLLIFLQHGNAFFLSNSAYFERLDLLIEHSNCLSLCHGMCVLFYSWVKHFCRPSTVFTYS